jgi:NAD-dependent dihydropyrimidine dehydrogenase PreA subunit
MYSFFLRMVKPLNQSYQKIKKPKYLATGQIIRFNQKYTILSRSSWDPPIQKLKRKYQKKRIKLLRKKDKLAEFAIRDASWTVANTLGTFAGFAQGNDGLYSWKQLDSSDENLDINKEQRKIKAVNLEEISKKIKNSARFFGANLVGITKLNPLWIYSHSYNRSNGQNQTLNLPKSHKYVVIIGIEMDQDKIISSPLDASTATGLGYSKMSFVTCMLAQLIRNLGYKALPCGNDTALSIPLAIDAGLGELGRNGLLITPQFGPRIRLCKIITDLPLIPDIPIDFGVHEYCSTCNECVIKCPANAISNDETSKSTSISNNPGIMKCPVNGEKCYEYWSRQGIDCSICIKVCPFNKI